ncbi:RagB/SusD family nutrient uptake outer membrane protein [Pseudoflavitalea sp. G-6-1-2]|uniref:RagB/SusD family nutrient uptake outer membrane protein n=1 Tax=Pseudoflavitalea sp. G-6-1-2 TaxID=2728841 RepID=UPI00146BF8DB|nr:RagB/SusD family nutrient uptake outer membrane protein [Pseudoflavitalea sp. G-6-1-2]NML22429.1 RagB/SusD family nutrient uptake outer membrane protein [Pseudoflavitalea sp. G-6-1-2]
MHSATNRIWIPLICILCISTLSCKKFLATYSQNNSFIETTSDLDEILVGDAYLDHYNISTPDMLYTMDDDVNFNIPSSLVKQYYAPGFYGWQAQPRLNSEGQLDNTDRHFNLLYSRIARINTILLNVTALKEKGQPENVLNRISGEAHFLRALYYFMLVNIYGKPYKPATAATDFGVPLKTEAAIKEQFAARSSTKEVYELMVADLLQAEKELAGANESSTIRANQASAQGLLSRIYLYMEDYQKAVQYADLVINKQQYQLTNLNVHPTDKDFIKKYSPEVIFTMGSNRVGAYMASSMDIPIITSYKVSDDLVMAYSQNDLRRQVFFKTNSRGDIRIFKKRESEYSAIDDVSDCYLIRYAEIYLNKAEALAALDRFEEARNTLQYLRKTRFRPDEVPVSNAQGETLINEIRNERRLELCFEVHRWFDLRRYGVNSKYPFSKTIRHRNVIYTANGYIESGYFELGPYEQDKAAYIVPIANDEIEFNQGMLTNEPRPDRPVKH